VTASAADVSGFLQTALSKLPRKRIRGSPSASLAGAALIGS